MEITPYTIIFGVVLPVVWAAIVWGGWFFFTRDRNGHEHFPKLAGICAALAPVGAYGFAFWSTEPRGPFPPIDSVQWLFYAAFGVGAIAILEAVFRSGRWYFKPLFWLPAMFLVLFLVSRGWRNLEGDLPDTFKFTKLQAAGAMTAWVLAAMAIRAAAGWQGSVAPTATVWTLGLTSAFSAVVIGMSGSTIAPFRMASIGLCLLPLLALLFTFRRPAKHGHLPAPTLTVYVAMFAGTLLAAYLFYTLTAVNGILLAAALVAPVLLPPKFKGLWPALVRVALALIPLGIAFGLALHAFMESQKESAGY